MTTESTRCSACDGAFQQRFFKTVLSAGACERPRALGHQLLPARNGSHELAGLPVLDLRAGIERADKNGELRWLEDGGGLSVFRRPSNNSKGNTFDLQGGELSCEHLTRRVVPYENDGSVTLIADMYQGKCLNSPHNQ